MIQPRAQQGFSRIVRHAGRFSPLLNGSNNDFRGLNPIRRSLMYEKLPSLLGFQPKFSNDGPAGFHLHCFTTWSPAGSQSPLWCSDSATGRPFLPFVRRRVNGTWKPNALLFGAIAQERTPPMTSPGRGKDYGQEFYGARARFVEGAANALKNARITVSICFCSTIAIRPMKSAPIWRAGKRSFRRMPWFCFMAWNWNARMAPRTRGTSG